MIITVLIQVDEIYSVPEVGTVVGGTLYRLVTIFYYKCTILLFLKGPCVIKLFKNCVKYS